MGRNSGVDDNIKSTFRIGVLNAAELCGLRIAEPYCQGGTTRSRSYTIRAGSEEATNENVSKFLKLIIKVSLPVTYAIRVSYSDARPGEYTVISHTRLGMYMTSLRAPGGKTRRDYYDADTAIKVAIDRKH
jgi:hypothetical protein